MFPGQYLETDFSGERVAHQLTSGGKDRPEPAAPRSAPPLVDAIDSDVGPRHLIPGKLKPPQSATTCIERTALLSRLDAGSQRKTYTTDCADRLGQDHTARAVVSARVFRSGRGVVVAR